MAISVMADGAVNGVSAVENFATDVPLAERPCRDKPNDVFYAAATKATWPWQYAARWRASAGFRAGRRQIQFRQSRLNRGCNTGLIETAVAQHAGGLVLVDKCVRDAKL